MQILNKSKLNQYVIYNKLNKIGTKKYGFIRLHIHKYVKSIKKNQEKPLHTIYYHTIVSIAATQLQKN